MSDEGLAVQAHDLKTMGDLFGKLLSGASISRLVIVDDSYAANGVDIDEIVIAAQRNREAFLDLIPTLKRLEDDETDHISTVVREALGGDATLTAQAWDICQQVACEDAGLDAETMTVLDKLIDAIPKGCSIEVLRLSGEDWHERATSLLEPEQGSVLVLVDRNFAREGKSSDHGLTLIASLLKDAKKCVYCALISYTVRPEDELEQWTTLAEVHGIPLHQFIVVSKHRLAEDQTDLPGFLHLMRLAILCGPLKDLKNRVRDHFASAITETNKKLETWSVFDFDEAVFGSSRKEGIWEGETLIRVMTVFATQAARRGIFGDKDIRDTIGLARGASSVQIPYVENPHWRDVGRMALTYQRAEMYYEQEYVNGYHLPLESGDLFACKDDNKQYILLAQPCDLMVRGSSGRAYDNHYSRFVSLCNIRNSAPAGREQFYELKDWDDSGNSGFVHFSDVHMVRAVMLDLCVTQQDGSVTFLTNEEPPIHMSKSWQEHMVEVRNQLKQESIQAHELTKALSHKKLNLSKILSESARRKLSPYCSNTGKFKATLTEEGFSVNLRRVGRLNAAIAADVLRTFSRYQSRTAFDQSVVTDGLRTRINSPANPATHNEPRADCELPVPNNYSPGDIIPNSFFWDADRDHETQYSNCLFLRVPGTQHYIGLFKKTCG